MGRRNFDRAGRNYHSQHDDRLAIRANFPNKNNIKDRLGNKERHQQDPESGIMSRLGGGVVKRRNTRGVNFHVNLGDLSEDNFVGGQTRGFQRKNLRGGRGKPWQRADTLHPRALNRIHWHKITLVRGAKYDREELLKMILGMSSVKFVPICYETKAGRASFFVEKHDAALQIISLNGKITTNDNRALEIIGEKCLPPISQIDEDAVQSIKVAMSDRYNPTTRALNLSSFHNSFPGKSFYIPLSRSTVMQKVVEIILEHIPEVVAIDLSNNQIFALEPLVPYIDRLQNLTILYLNNNKITNMRYLSKLKGLPLVELKMEGNVVCADLGESFVDAVREVFPTLQVLDGRTLSKQITFDEDEKRNIPLPVAIQKYIKDTSVESIILQFVQQYFKLFDADSRQPLLDAYSEAGMMSMSACGRADDIKHYIGQSRNLLHLNDFKKVKLLRKGRLPIVSALSELPKTKHDLSSFTLDVPLISTNLIMFTVTGVFRERDTKDDQTFKFSRCFLVAPQGTGLCIINETYHVGPAAWANATDPTTPDSGAQNTLAAALSSVTRMKVDWAAKCLEENAWNYDKAVEVFLRLKEAGKVPPEAFA